MTSFMPPASRPISPPISSTSSTLLFSSQAHCQCPPSDLILPLVSFKPSASGRSVASTPPSRWHHCLPLGGMMGSEGSWAALLFLTALSGLGMRSGQVCGCVSPSSSTADVTYLFRRYRSRTAPSVGLPTLWSPSPFPTRFDAARRPRLPLLFFQHLSSVRSAVSASPSADVTIRLELLWGREVQRNCRARIETSRVYL